ncbi:pyridoxamine 5'-phosphate oxidase [Psychromarinibacter sp. C21-152]|uniref:Pyridoxine/pyridoxamine 5'-phosphate oxidase n=1 Tax=Psychromarinibacter sediminicola TaxID=3033385 RepID=A0AAE3NPW4_9RHOB|nr:pyridoxamine 5'-phosphate oxidase [Psychromarinibacter sediminicola]MDF0599489.1 pyridoxamine 5'-phosphate oxidase [Psychromarinibacter sediminicola]
MVTERTIHAGQNVERTGIFAGDDPFAIVARWLDEARETEPSDPDAIALATADETGLPNVRMVLLRGLEPDAFVFYTNYRSAKGQELAANGKAAFVLHWKSLRRQIRVRGLVEKEDGALADSYYAGRPLQSRLGAWASEQSRPLKSRASLMAKVAKAGVTHGPSPARPPFWGGFRIRPVEIEFWADGDYRLHDRFRWRRADPGSAWAIDRLNP